MENLEHSDVSAALRTGHRRGQRLRITDSPEERARYVEEYESELLDWIKENHPDLVDQWLEESGYEEWLNSEE